MAKRYNYEVVTKKNIRNGTVKTTAWYDTLEEAARYIGMDFDDGFSEATIVKRRIKNKEYESDTNI